MEWPFPNSKPYSARGRGLGGNNRDNRQGRIVEELPGPSNQDANAKRGRLDEDVESPPKSTTGKRKYPEDPPPHPGPRPHIATVEEERLMSENEKLRTQRDHLLREVENLKRHAEHDSKSYSKLWNEFSTFKRSASLASASRVERMFLEQEIEELKHGRFIGYEQKDDEFFERGFQTLDSTLGNWVESNFWRAYVNLWNIHELNKAFVTKTKYQDEGETVRERYRAVAAEQLLRVFAPAYFGMLKKTEEGLEELQRNIQNETESRKWRSMTLRALYKSKPEIQLAREEKMKENIMQNFESHILYEYDGLELGQRCLMMQGFHRLLAACCDLAHESHMLADSYIEFERYGPGEPFDPDYMVDVQGRDITMAQWYTVDGTLFPAVIKKSFEDGTEKVLKKATVVLLKKQEPVVYPATAINVALQQTIPINPGRPLSDAERAARAIQGLKDQGSVHLLEAARREQKQAFFRMLRRPEIERRFREEGERERARKRAREQARAQAQAKATASRI